MARKISRKASRKGSRKLEKAQYQKHVPEPETVVKQPMDDLDSVRGSRADSAEQHFSPGPLKTTHENDAGANKTDEHHDPEKELEEGEAVDEESKGDGEQQGEVATGDANVRVVEGDVAEKDEDEGLEDGEMAEDGEVAEGGDDDRTLEVDEKEVEAPETDVEAAKEIQDEPPSAEAEVVEVREGVPAADVHVPEAEQEVKPPTIEENADARQINQEPSPTAKSVETDLEETRELQSQKEAAPGDLSIAGGEGEKIRELPSQKEAPPDDLSITGGEEELQSQKEAAPDGVSISGVEIQGEIGQSKEVSQLPTGIHQPEEQVSQTNEEPGVKEPTPHPMAGVTFVARPPRQQQYEELGVPYETGTRALTHDRPDEEEVQETVAEANAHRKKCKYEPAEDIRITKPRAQDVQFIWRGSPKGRRIVHQEELLPETQASLEIAKQLHEMLAAPKHAKKILERFDDPDRLEEREAIHVAKAYWTQDVEYRRRMFEQYEINTEGLEDRRASVFPAAVFLVHQDRDQEDFEKSILEQRSQDARWVWSNVPKATGTDRWAQWRLTNAINNQYYRMYHKFNTATFRIRR